MNPSLSLQNRQTNELLSVEDLRYHLCLDFVATKVENWREANYFASQKTYFLVVQLNFT